MGGNRKAGDGGIQGKIGKLGKFFGSVVSVRPSLLKHGIPHHGSPQPTTRPHPVAAVNEKSHQHGAHAGGSCDNSRDGLVPGSGRSRGVVGVEGKRRRAQHATRIAVASLLVAMVVKFSPSRRIAATRSNRVQRWRLGDRKIE